VTATMKLNLVLGAHLDEGKLYQRHEKMDKHRDLKGLWTCKILEGYG
jgi:hypothetical protein